MKNLSVSVVVILFQAIAIVGQADVDTHIRDADALTRDRKFAEAAAELGKAINIEPRNANLYLKRARLLLFARDMEAFYSDIDRVWKLFPDDEQVFLTASRLLMETGERTDCEKVITMADAFLTKHSQSDQAYDSRFRAKTCLNDLAGAFNDISMALQIDPENVGHRANRANLISRLGDASQALEIYDRMIRDLETEITAVSAENAKLDIKRELAMIYFSRSRIHEKAGDIAQQLTDISRSVELMPISHFLRFRAGYFRKHRMYEEAIADYTRAIAADKDTSFLLLAERADVYYLLKKYELALADYEKAASLNPEFKPRIEPRIEELKKILAAQDE